MSIGIFLFVELTDKTYSVETMIVVTTDNIQGRNISEVIGLATGSSVKARHIGSDILAGFKNIVGGEVAGYTKLMNDTRGIALERMVEDAKSQGADAIVGLRFVSSEVTQGVVELCAYGTAVKL